MDTSKKNTSEKIDLITWILIILAFSFIMFSFFSPIIFTSRAIWGIDFSNSGVIGDTIGGIMSPFVGIAGIIITFLAFYMQYKANKLQRELFDEQIQKEKDQFKEELTEQREQFRKNQFETQFYEMIRLHKENVNDIFVNISRISGQESNEYQLFGRKNFEFFLDEIEIAYHMAKKIFKNRDKYYHINQAYGVVFHGIKSTDYLKPTKPEQENYSSFYNLLINIKLGHRMNQFNSLTSGGIYIYTNHFSNFKTKNELNYDIFEGYSSFLGHYYRQLFQTVKFVVTINFLTYEEKRKYLRILRAQLTNHEQVMLFYNWLAKFGEKWQNSENKFFTDYRMIHNIYNELIISDFSLIEEFGLITNENYLKEENRSNDKLFEFEDW